MFAVLCSLKPRDNWAFEEEEVEVRRDFSLLKVAQFRNAREPELFQESISVYQAFKDIANEDRCLNYFPRKYATVFSGGSGYQMTISCSKN